MMCKCEEDYMMTQAKKCLKKYGKVCEADADCYSGKCTSKKCACANANENYSKASMKCVAGELFGADCSSKSCYASNLECPSTGDKKCKCKKYFKQKDSNDDICMESDKKNYDDTCTDNDDCNPMANLKCVGTPKKCGCEGSDYKKTKVPYTDDMGKVSEWYKCVNESATMDVKKGEECTSGKYDYTAKFCEKNLKCLTCGGGTDLKCREKSSDPSGAVQVTFSLLAAIGCLALRKVLM